MLWLQCCNTWPLRTFVNQSWYSLPGQCGCHTSSVYCENKASTYCYTFSMLEGTEGQTSCQTVMGQSVQIKWPFNVSVTELLCCVLTLLTVICQTGEHTWCLLSGRQKHSYEWVVSSSEQIVTRGQDKKKKDKDALCQCVSVTCVGVMQMRLLLAYRTRGIPEHLFGWGRTGFINVPVKKKRK